VNCDSASHDVRQRDDNRAFESKMTFPLWMISISQEFIAFGQQLQTDRAVGFTIRISPL
jgi:hypothetical protein